MRHSRPRLSSVLLAGLVALAALVPAIAQGSQYPLDQAAAIIPAEHVPKLHVAGVHTTGDFLRWGRTAYSRRSLAMRAALPVDLVTTWVFLADLMRVRGIGPDVARLLTAVGVRSLSDLKRAEAATTAAAIRAFNSRAHLSTNPPGAESIRYWIDQSQSLPVLIQLE